MFRLSSFCFFILMLLLSPTTPAHAQVPDSLYLPLRSAEVDTQLVGLWGLVKHYTEQRGGSDSAAYYANRVISVARSHDRPYYLGYGYSSLAANAAKRRRYEESIELAQLGLPPARRSGDSLLIGLLYRRLGYAYSQQERQEESLHHYRRAVRYYDLYTQTDKYYDSKVNVGAKHSKLGQYQQARLVLDTLLLQLDTERAPSPRVQAKLYNTLAEINRHLNNGQLAEDFALRALRIKRSIGDFRGEMVALSKLASIANEEDRYEDGERYGLRALHLADSLRRPRAVVVVATNLGNLYKNTRQYGLAESYYQRAITLADELNMPSSTGIARLNLAALLLERNDLLTAEAILREVAKYVRDSKSTEFIKEYYSALANLRRLQGNHEAALTYFKRYHALHDTLAVFEKSKVIAEMNARYEAANRESEIQLLKKDAELTELTASRLRQQKGWLIGGGLGLLLLIGILINRNRLKQRSLSTIRQQHAEIETKSRENETLVREVHHRVKNNMQIMQSLLWAQRNNHPDNEELKEALRVCEGQLASMALIHQDLYRAQNFTAVNSRQYFSQLIENIRSAYDDRTRNIRFVVELIDYELHTTQAVPLGLVLNELVTNAVKYAFSDQAMSRQITVRQTFAKSGFNLLVADNGVGVQKQNFELLTRHSFGLRMVKGLVRQIGGRLALLETAGTAFEIYVPHLSSEELEAETPPRTSTEAV